MITFTKYWAVGMEDKSSMSAIVTQELALIKYL